MGAIQSEGPCPCEFLIIGEAPGRDEERARRPFVGRASVELQERLNGRDLPHREDVHLTYLHRTWRGKDYKWTEADVDAALPDLLADVARVQPRILIPLGRTVTRLLLGDVDLDAVQGLPWYLPETSVVRAALPGSTPAMVFPIVSPAAGFHNPELSPYVVAGFTALGAFLDGQLTPRQLFDDPYPQPVYRELTTPQAVETATRHWNPSTLVAVDTEGWPGNPWSLQFSDAPGTGFLIRATQPACVAAWGRALHARRPRLIFHSALHDLGMFRALGLDPDGLAFDDTMIMAYLLQLEPQGLKPGCLRHCNMRMDEYSDLLGDTQHQLARQYLTWVWDGEQAAYEARQQAALAEAQAAGRRVRVLPKLPKTPLHRAAERVLQSKRPRTLWLDQVEDLQVAAYQQLGPMPEATLDYVDPARALHYGCRDADATLRYRAELLPRIEALGLRGVYDLECGTYPLIDRMARVGVQPDLPHFARLSATLQTEIDRLQATLTDQAGRALNANSGDQVAQYLFETLGLTPLKMTKEGRGSTNDKVLEALEHEHPEYPVLSTIRSYRETYKLKHTFVDRLPDFVHRWPYDGRIHATFRTTRVITGRLAASDPNLLAQPEHGQFAKEFKKGWVAGPGRVLCQWDESQVELRGLAHLSRDPVMLGVFRGERRNPDGSPIDLHAALAERIFGVKPKDQDKTRHRLPAKAINFGIPMGMTSKGLSVELRKNGVDADEDTAQRWLDETLGLYQGVRQYMEDRKAEARRQGYVRCLSGRIRYIGGIRSRDDRVREEAERFAFSTPIQESAQFIMKQAERIVYEDILVPYWRQGVWVEPILQVHDCLKMECQAGLERELNDLMTHAMTQVPQGLLVPLAVEGEWGPSMGEMESF